VTTTLIAQISDPHLRLDEEATSAAFAAAVARVLKLNPLPAAVIVTGDIANSGDPREHERALGLLAALPMPVHRLAGNHDQFEGRTRYAAEAGGVRVVACDTSIPGRDEGTLELDWLAERLSEDRETPTIVAMHHPPLLTGLAWLDEIGLPLPDRTALAELLAASPQVKRVVAGHVHRVIHSTLGGCGVVTCTSTNIQFALDFVATEMLLTSEPPSVLVHALVDDQIVTHVQPV
jgi:3',5'-cyclic AMP phosphodiesterase CpdA